MRPNIARNPEAEEPRHAIGSMAIDFAVASDTGPLGTPESILFKTRAHLLPALERVLEGPALRGASASVEVLEIDLGDWPENPSWSDVSRVFSEQLLAALQPYLRWSDAEETPKQPVTSPSTAEVSETPERVENDILHTASNADDHDVEAEVVVGVPNHKIRALSAFVAQLNRWIPSETDPIRRSARAKIVQALAEVSKTDALSESSFEKLLEMAIHSLEPVVQEVMHRLLTDTNGLPETLPTDHSVHQSRASVLGGQDNDATAARPIERIARSAGGPKLQDTVSFPVQNAEPVEEVDGDPTRVSQASEKPAAALILHDDHRGGWVGEKPASVSDAPGRGVHNALSDHLELIAKRATQIEGPLVHMMSQSGTADHETLLRARAIAPQIAALSAMRVEDAQDPVSNARISAQVLDVETFASSLVPQGTENYEGDVVAQDLASAEAVITYAAVDNWARLLIVAGHSETETVFALRALNLIPENESVKPGGAGAGADMQSGAGRVSPEAIQYGEEQGLSEDQEAPSHDQRDVAGAIVEPSSAAPRTSSLRHSQRGQKDVETDAQDATRLRKATPTKDENTPVAHRGSSPHEATGRGNSTQQPTRATGTQRRVSNDVFGQRSEEGPEQPERLRELERRAGKAVSERDDAAKPNPAANAEPPEAGDQSRDDLVSPGKPARHGARSASRRDQKGLPDVDPSKEGREGLPADQAETGADTHAAKPPKTSDTGHSNASRQGSGARERYSEADQNIDDRFGGDYEGAQPQKKLTAGQSQQPGAHELEQASARAQRSDAVDGEPDHDDPDGIIDAARGGAAALHHDKIDRPEAKPLQEARDGSAEDQTQQPGGRELGQPSARAQHSDAEDSEPDRSDTDGIGHAASGGAAVLQSILPTVLSVADALDVETGRHWRILLDLVWRALPLRDAHSAGHMTQGDRVNDFLENTTESMFRGGTAGVHDVSGQEGIAHTPLLRGALTTAPDDQVTSEKSPEPESIEAQSTTHRAPDMVEASQAPAPPAPAARASQTVEETQPQAALDAVKNMELTEYVRAVMALGSAPRGPDDLFETFLEKQLAVLFPDGKSRQNALRQVAARLSYSDGSYAPAMRTHALTVVEKLLSQNVPAVGQDQTLPAPNRVSDRSKNDDNEAVSTDPKQAYLSQRGGLVLLHPFLPLLFGRLDLLDSKRQIPKSNIAVARRALQLIGDTQADEDQPTDAVEKLLLGVPQNWAVPGEKVSEQPDLALINSLLASVVERWGALGQTSPDGLRDAFICRNATLRRQDTAWSLRVENGPFDMLLDRLPWSFGTIGLPWMPEPCNVHWRDSNA